MAYYGGYETDPYRSRGDDFESDHVGSADHDGGEDGTLLKQPADPKAEAGLLSIWKNVSDPILDMRLDYTIPVYYHSRIFNVIID
jgi:hypothetical protein